MRSLKSTERADLVEVRGLVTSFATRLAAHGYRQSVISAYSAAIEHFIAWTAPNAARVEVTGSAVRRFLNEHLRDCKCPGPIQRWPITVRAALNHLLTMTVGARLHEQEAKFPAHIAAELVSFCRYATEVCGLASATLVSRQQWIGRFLTHQFPNDEIDCSRVR